MKRISALLASATMVVCAALPAAAQQAQGQQGQSMPGMQMQGGQSMNMQNMGPAHQEFMAAMDKMQKAMMQGMMDPDPGMAWTKQMIAHHQGAVDTSEIVLKHTKDENVRKEARKTKEQNEKDIKDLQALLRKESK